MKSASGEQQNMNCFWFSLNQVSSRWRWNDLEYSGSAAERLWRIIKHEKQIQADNVWKELKSLVPQNGLLFVEVLQIKTTFISVRRTQIVQLSQSLHAAPGPEWM